MRALASEEEARVSSMRVRTFLSASRLALAA